MLVSIPSSLHLFSIFKMAAVRRFGFGMTSGPHDVISDHRLVFDGRNILLKLYPDRIYTLQDIAIFVFGLFGLKNSPLS